LEVENDVGAGGCAADEDCAVRWALQGWRVVGNGSGEHCGEARVADAAAAGESGGHFAGFGKFEQGAAFW
jgi:hypothetical protein